MSARTDVPQGPPQGPRHDVEPTHRSVSQDTTKRVLRADLGPIRPVSLFTLIRVELRKMFNTRAARGYCLAIGLVFLGMVAIMFSVNQGNEPFQMYVNANVQFMAYLLPILGIMLVTAEWGQRTAMTTFSLEPRRGRVITAKIIVTLIVSAVLYLVALGLAVLGHRAAITLRGGTENWEVGAPFLAGIGIFLLVNILFGLALAFLLHNTPGSIVAFFLLPIASSILFELVAPLREVREWFDLTSAYIPLLGGDGTQGLDSEQWAHIGVTFVIWVLIPLALGIWRTLRREVK